MDLTTLVDYMMVMEILFLGGQMQQKKVLMKNHNASLMNTVNFQSKALIKKYIMLMER